jgi:hypothetical protein
MIVILIRRSSVVNPIRPHPESHYISGPTAKSVYMIRKYEDINIAHSFNISILFMLLLSNGQIVM